LLLDEPTNHLDLNALEWLETYLKNYRGSLLLISHDRYFLDQVVTRILELDHGVLTSYTGNYSRYLVLKAEAEAAQEKAFASQQKMLAKEQAYIEKNRAGRMAKQARGREKKLARIELINNVQSQKKAHLRQFDVDTSAKIVLDIQDLSKSFGAETVFHDLNLTVFRQDRIGIIGPNGCGKSTLLKTIIGQLPADGGDVAFGSRVQWAYYDQEQSRLNFDSTVLDQVLYNSYLDLPESRAELAKMLFTENDWEKRVGSLSGGEKARLSLLMLLLEQPNFIIMDEPTNHLDIASKRIMEDYLQTYKGTLLIVSHDRYFLDQVTEKTWAFEEQGIQIYYGNYSYYREKKAEQREMEALKTASLTAPDAPHQQSSLTAKTTKRNISKSKLRKTIADCELAIAEKEAALADAEEALLTAAKDYTEDALATYEAHVQQKELLEAELEELYQTWSHSSDLLEELTHE
ncbi:MAG: ABC-F family ATP-binding cassette domain-containing protein, partial [Peptococcus niger]